MQTDLDTMVRKCQEGQLEYFTFVFDEFSKKIYNFIFFRTHHKQTAEDITSLVFLKALENIQSFKPTKGSFSSWLYQIARNSVVDHYRAAKHTENIEDAWDISANVNIERDTDTAASLDKVREYIKTLPALQRDIVIMRVWDGLSHKEIAEILRISEANSKMSFSRAMAKMNKEIAVSLALILLISLP